MSSLIDFFKYAFKWTDLLLFGFTKVIVFTQTKNGALKLSNPRKLQYQHGQILNDGTQIVHYKEILNYLLNIRVRNAPLSAMNVFLSAAFSNYC